MNLPSAPPPPTAIVIAEDSPTQAEQLTFILERHGHRPILTRNGHEALAAVAREQPALVVSDIVMPGMDGYELCRRLKADHHTHDLPVILLTSLSDPVDVVRGLECGADGFVFKPYDESYLVARIASILATRHLRETDGARMGIEVFFAGRRFFITSDRLQILNLLLSTYETAVERNHALAHARDELRQLNETLEQRVQERTAALRAEMLERRQAEAHVREQAELLDKARDAIIATDLDHRVTHWNAGAQRIYGWSAQAVLGRRIEDLGFGLSLEHFAAAHAALIARGEWRGAYEFHLPGGETRQIESSWSLVFDEAERPRSILCIDTDVTERKKLEEAVLRAQRVDCIGMLASGIAHDVNNALSPILMAAEMLMLEDPGPQQRHFLELIRNGAQRSADMVKQILAFARGDAGGRSHAVDLAALCQEIGELCRRTFPRNIDVALEISPRLRPFAGEPTQFHQLLLNLCVNARDAMPDGGTLSISAGCAAATGASASAAGEEIVLVVTDTGVGMPPEVAARIFDPFFTTKTSGKGTGLGLSTVQSIIRHHRGDLAVESHPGRGTRFTVRLPAVPIEPAVPVLVPEPLPTGAGELVLVVDHEASIRGLAAQTLETFGYRVLTASHGPEAVALCRQHRAELQLMVVDALMPVMDGLATLHAIREFLPTLRIIMTGCTETVPVEASAGLCPPYNPDDLLRAVHDTLRRPAKPPETRLPGSDVAVRP